MDAVEQVLDLLAKYVPEEALSLCDLLEQRVRGIGDRVVATKLISAVRAKCGDRQ
jgi:hypothetical protein